MHSLCGLAGKVVPHQLPFPLASPTYFVAFPAAGASLARRCGRVRRGQAVSSSASVSTGAVACNTGMRRSASGNCGPSWDPRGDREASRHRPEFGLPCVGGIVPFARPAGAGPPSTNLASPLNVLLRSVGDTGGASFGNARCDRPHDGVLVGVRHEPGARASMG